MSSEEQAKLAAAEERKRNKELKNTIETGSKPWESNEDIAFRQTAAAAAEARLQKKTVKGGVTSAKVEKSLDLAFAVQEQKMIKYGFVSSGASSPTSPTPSLPSPTLARDASVYNQGSAPTTSSVSASNPSVSHKIITATEPNVDALNFAMGVLQANNEPDVSMAAAKTLQLILENILNAKTDEDRAKFKRIKQSSKMIQSTIVPAEGASEFLLGCGFNVIQDDASGEKFFLLPPSVDLSILSQALSMLVNAVADAVADFPSA